MQLTFSLFEPITVKPPWEVLTYGAHAHARDGAGSNGPIRTGDLMLDSRGCREWGTHTAKAHE